MTLSKRKHQEVDPTKSDSDDEDYDATPEKSNRHAAARKRQRKSKKRKRRADNSDISESDEDDSEEDFATEMSDNDLEVERDERTGRPIRKAAKQTKTYEESEDEPEESDHEERHKPTSKPRSKVVRLKVSTPQPSHLTSGQTPHRGHGTRDRQQRSVEPQSAITRRSTRLHQDETEVIVKLTDSGRHAQLVGQTKTSPRDKTPRHTRGGKGVKGPASSNPPDEIDESEPLVPRSELGSASESGEGVALVNDSDEEIVAAGADENEEEVAQNKALDLDEDGQEVDSNAGKSREGGSVQGEEEEEEEEDDDDDGPVLRGRRSTQHPKDIETEQTSRPARKSKRQRKGIQEPSSDFEFEPGEGDEDPELSSSQASSGSPRKSKQRRDEVGDESSNGRRSGRGRTVRGASAARRKADSDSEHDDSEVAEELAEELQDLKEGRPRRSRRADIVFDEPPKLRNRKKNVDYRIMRPDLVITEDQDAPPAASTTRRGRGGGGGNGGGTWPRSLFSTQGPFGGAGGPSPVFGGAGATGGVDSDSSEDERVQRAGGFGGAVGMTPTSAVAPGLLPAAQAHGQDAAQGLSGTPANLGKIKDRKALADADPLGVDQNVSFESVGGLQDQINQLKEMVSLPLLYPEIFHRFHVTPPRGVLFHGPPGTGKTLLARALAASVSSQGRKITFYMRKGADALSKWVGEAERQLRLLFDEARANQPSIIFFDEIDGLAPVRSSKQEQIHASIVSTLLALMDGMDGRGQVIVIGATNRPDSIDPALRRPGRFDREFYFPLPKMEARRSIINIHTKGWQPGLSDAFKDQLAEMTKGYGGADLRALCTEAALNAVQRRYPQIYTSNEKLEIDPSTINITAKDFMISIKKLVPSSERASTSAAAPLPPQIETLLRVPLQEIQSLVAELLPHAKKLTALEEAQFEEDDDPDGGFQREKLQQEFESSRIYRPRLLIRGTPGMGQQYLARALLSHFEGLHVQPFDLSTLLSDSTRSPEAAIVQLFAEVRRHKPSVIYLPNVDSWYRAVGPTVVSTFLGLLHGLPPTEPVLLLGILESEPEYVDKIMLKNLFGFSKRNQFELSRPDQSSRRLFFKKVADLTRKPPNEFPDPSKRKKRIIEQLKLAPPPPPPPPPSKEERQAQKKRDRQVLNMLKIRIQPVMDQIKLRYRKFRTGIIEDDQIRYLYEEQDPEIVGADAPQRHLFRPFEKSKDRDGIPGLLEVESQKFYYNLNIVMIEERLSNGWYKRPKDFTTDIRCLAKDAKTLGDRDRTIKANEMLSNVEVDMAMLESEPALADCENVFLRETARAKERAEKHAQSLAAAESRSQIASNAATLGSASASASASALVSDQPSTGPLILGEPVPNTSAILPSTPSRPGQTSPLSNGYATEIVHIADPGSRLPTSNGSSHPSRDDGDVHMADSNEALALEPTQESDVMVSSRPTLPVQGGASAASNQSGQNTQRSQKGPITSMPPGSQVDDFLNSASTTTSGKKTSDQSNRSSDWWNTPSSNGIGANPRNHQPDYSGLEFKGRADSQLPDTQAEGLSSQSSGGQSSQSQPASHPGSQPPVPAFNAKVPPNPNVLGTMTARAAAHPEWVVDDAFVEELHEGFTDRTSGCSVEQLEQIHTALMDSIWKQRGEWNRVTVGREVMRTFNEVMQDIEQMQDILPDSLGDE